MKREGPWDSGGCHRLESGSSELERQKKDGSRRVKILTFVIELLQQVFVPFDVVALFRGDRGKIHFDEVGHRSRETPVERVKAAAQVDDLAGMVADLLEHFLDAHLDASDTGKVAAIDFGCLPDSVLHKVANVVVLPVAQLDRA